MQLSRRSFFKFTRRRMRFMQRIGSCWHFMAILSAMVMTQANIHAAKCPCDIYAAGGTPCVAAHSTVRALYGNYNGPLYQVTRKSDSAKMDIRVLGPGGLANAAKQDSFLIGTTGHITLIYDQSANRNHLTAGHSGYWGPPDTPAIATDARIKINGHTVYGIYTNGANAYVHPGVMGVGYRNDSTTGVPTGNRPEGIYMVCSGTHYNNDCCFDYGNAETNDSSNGPATMEAIYFGNGTGFGSGSGSGPWVLADLEEGTFGGETKVYSGNTSITANYVTAMLKGDSINRYAIKAGNANSGSLKTMYSGARPSGYYPMKKEGAIVLGIGGDNSHAGVGTFFEGAVISGYPADSTEDSIQANIVAAGYGKTTPPVSIRYNANETTTGSLFRVHYNPSNASAVISYTLQDARSVKIIIVDQRGSRIAGIINGEVPAGRHEAVWDTKRVPAAVYVCRMTFDGIEEWTGKVIVRK